MNEQQTGFFEQTHKLTEQYIQDRLLLLKLQATEKTARLSGLLISFLIIALLSFFVLLFISIIAGFLLASAMGGNVLCGFGTVAGFYILLLVLMLIFRKRLIEKIIANTVIKVLFDRTNDTNEIQN